MLHARTAATVFLCFLVPQNVPPQVPQTVPLHTLERTLILENIFRHKPSLDSRHSILHAQAVAPGTTETLGGQMSPRGSLERCRWITSTGSLIFEMNLPASNKKDFRILTVLA